MMSAKAGTTWVLCEVMASRRAEAGYASGVVLAWRHGPRAHAAPTDSGAYSCAGAGIGVRTKHDSCTEAAQARIRISTRDRHARAHERDLRRYVQSRIDLLTLAGGFSLRCATRWVAFGPLLSVPSPDPLRPRTEVPNASETFYFRNVGSALRPEGQLGKPSHPTRECPHTLWGDVARDSRRDFRQRRFRAPRTIGPTRPILPHSWQVVRITVGNWTLEARIRTLRDLRGRGLRTAPGDATSCRIPGACGG